MSAVYRSAPSVCRLIREKGMDLEFAVIRSERYCLEGPTRFPLSRDVLPFETPLRYQPPVYLHGTVAAGPFWASKQRLLADLPLNPTGRHGIAERGFLGQYGPNNAADPLVTRFAREKGVIVYEDHRPVIEFIGVLRAPGTVGAGQWAIPGGMVEPGHTLSLTLLKELKEEAMHCENSEAVMQQFEKWFSTEGISLYDGYSYGDPRNTDHAWMTTTCIHVHDYSGDETKFVNLSADGAETTSAQWVRYQKGVTKLFAMHELFLEMASERVN